MSNSFDDRHNELYSEWGENDAYFTFPRWLVEQKKKDEQRIQQLELKNDTLVEAIKTALYGTKIDEFNRCEDGLGRFPDIPAITRCLAAALIEEPT